MHRAVTASLVAACALCATAVFADALARRVVVGKPAAGLAVALPQEPPAQKPVVQLDAQGLAAAKRAAAVGMHATDPSKLTASIVLDPTHLNVTVGSTNARMGGISVNFTSRSPEFWWLPSDLSTDRYHDGTLFITLTGLPINEPLLLECTFGHENTPSANVVIRSEPGTKLVYSEKVDLDGDQILFAFRTPATATTSLHMVITPLHAQHNSLIGAMWTGCKIHPVL